MFPGERVIVELDGYRYHHSRASFERDRERDAATLAAGHVTVRITWERLRDHPRREAKRLHRILHRPDARPSRPDPLNGQPPTSAPGDRRPAEAQVARASDRSSRLDAGQVGMIEVQISISAPGPVQAQAGAPGGGDPAPQVSAGGRQQRVPRLTLAPGQRLELAELFEGIDAHLLVGSDRQPDAGVAVAQRRADSRRPGCPRSSGK